MTSKHRIKWTQKAVDQLIGIHDYIARFSEQNAKNVTDSIFKKTLLLETYPELGKIEKNTCK